MKQECTKRSCIYEIWCIKFQEIEEKKIEKDENLDEREKKEKKGKIPMKGDWNTYHPSHQ